MEDNITKKLNRLLEKQKKGKVVKENKIKKITLEKSKSEGKNQKPKKIKKINKKGISKITMKKSRKKVAKGRVKRESKKRNIRRSIKVMKKIGWLRGKNKNMES